MSAGSGSIFVLAFLLFSCLPATLHASFIFNVSQVGANVVTDGNGTLNTTSLTFTGTNQSVGALVDPIDAVISGGPTVALIPVDNYDGFTGPSSIGFSGPPSVPFVPQSGSGNLVALMNGQTIQVPDGYVSGSPLSDTDTYPNVTLSYIGFTPGTYVYTWGSGATADSLTIHVGVVPEPATCAALAIPGALALLRGRRSRILVDAAGHRWHLGDYRQ